MSYVRFGWDGSDVYVFDGDGGLTCCGCRLQSPEWFVCGMPEEMIAHLGLHRRAGHFVPEYAITSLWNAIEGAVRPRKPQARSFLEAQIFMEAIALKMRQEREKLEE